MVSTAKSIANFRKAMIGQFFRQCHRYLPRPRDGPTALLRQQVSHPDLEILGDRFLDVLDGYQSLLEREQVA